MANNLVDVPEAWVEGKAYESGRFGTNGDVIWSYDVVIGFTAKGGDKLYISNTTASGSYMGSHCRAARKFADAGWTSDSGKYHSRWSCARENCDHLPDGVHNPKVNKEAIARQVNKASKTAKHYAEEVLSELEAATG